MFPFQYCFGIIQVSCYKVFNLPKNRHAREDFLNVTAKSLLNWNSQSQCVVSLCDIRGPTSVAKLSKLSILIRK